MRTLTNDPEGTAVFLEREARGMHPRQLYREFVQNGIEAGATKIIIDGWRDPETNRTLARISDNGKGMRNDELTHHLSTLHGQFKASGNYGIGARIAALPHNQLGVTFASRTADSEGMVRLYKEDDRYGLMAWPTEDDDGSAVLAEVVEPDLGILARMPVRGTGTAVVLHGNKDEDTWTSETSSDVYRFLSNRYYTLPEDVTIQVRDPGTRRRKVLPVGDRIAAAQTAGGEIQFKDVAGVDGAIFWWILKEPPKRRASAGGAMSGGVGLVIDNEVFNYARTYSGDFGLVYRPVQTRVAILINIYGAEMDTSRAGVILPGQERRNVPWKLLGAYFSDHMPKQIEDMLTAHTSRSESLDVEVAKLLDTDWMKRLRPIKVNTAAREGAPSVGEDAGQGVPKGEEQPNPQQRKPSKSPRRKAAGARSSSGRNPGKPKAKVVTPRVEFSPASDFDLENHPLKIYWHPRANTVYISDDFEPYVREVEDWNARVSHPKAKVVEAVRKAYMAEFAATIIDANGQAKFGLSPELVDTITSDGALRAKALGMQALTERIRAFLTPARKL